MLEWKDVLQTVVESLGSDADSIACLLEFLHVLPEEVTEGRKINLTVRAGAESGASNWIKRLTEYRKMSCPTGQRNYCRTMAHKSLHFSCNTHNLQARIA